jgi:succinate dehydrogenase / fumarate reductase cytochrome b subunit
MSIVQPASWFGRYEFQVRRFHSLTGLLPLSGYLCFHLATNAAVWDGPETYQRRADQIHVVGPTTLLFLEWGLIFLPILFHGLAGLVIVTRGRRNVFQYPYQENIRYTLQRGTGVVALAFILWHVFQMHGWFRFPWWVEHVARPLGGALFDPHHAPATAAAVLQSSPLMAGLYVVGILACVYHMSDGLWTFGITWGIWTSPRSQRTARAFCTALGIGLLIVGLAAIYGMEKVPLPAPAASNSPRSAGDLSYSSRSARGPSDVPLAREECVEGLSQNQTTSIDRCIENEPVASKPAAAPRVGQAVPDFGSSQAQPDLRFGLILNAPINRNLSRSERNTGDL